MIASSATYTDMVPGKTVIVSVNPSGDYKVTVGAKSEVIPHVLYCEDALRRVACQLAAS